MHNIVFHRRFFLAGAPAEIPQDFTDTGGDDNLKDGFPKFRAFGFIRIIFHPKQFPVRDKIHLGYFLEPFQGSFDPVYSGLT